jgi:hypothetical protein
MRSSPSIAPSAEPDVYLVLDNFGQRLGRAWRETSEEATDRATLLRDLLSGQFSDPVRIVAFNAEQRWSEDVSTEIVAELRQRVGEVPEHLAGFMDRHEPTGRSVQLSLPM